MHGLGVDFFKSENFNPCCLIPLLVPSVENARVFFGEKNERRVKDNNRVNYS